MVCNAPVICNHCLSTYKVGWGIAGFNLISAFVVHCLDSISTCYSWNFKTLASLISWAGRFESYLVANPKDRFSRDVAQMMFSRFENVWLIVLYIFPYCHLDKNYLPHWEYVTDTWSSVLNIPPHSMRSCVTVSILTILPTLSECNRFPERKKYLLDNTETGIEKSTC